MVGYSVAGRRGRMWLARGLTKATGAGREVNDFTPIATWADTGGKHGPRGGRQPLGDVATCGWPEG